MDLLVTLEQFKVSQGLPDVSEAVDDDLTLRLEIAQEMVIDYVSQRIGDTATDWDTTVTAWTEATVPVRVKAAILNMAGHLYRWRGDDDSKMASGELPADVTMYLHRLRDPAIA